MTPHDPTLLPPEADDAARRVENERLARTIMRRQAMLSLRVAAVFLLLILGLPLVNLYLPALAGTPILGFSATWLFLGVLFFPLTWLLSAYFIRHSDRIEADITDRYRAANGEAGADSNGGSV